MEEKKHVRRAHYSGKYPKRFEEKYKEKEQYKEKNPEQFEKTIEHVISKGSTPAGMHISIMVSEILSVLKIQPGERGLDATLGYGGHTSHMLEALQGNGHIVGLDVDPIESEKTLKRLREKGYGEDIFHRELINFANVEEVAKIYGKFDFILADLGVSSMQIDNPERGFSYKTEGPLDLRLDPTHGKSGAQILSEMDEEEIEGMLVENSDEPYASEIAKEIYRYEHSGRVIETTTQLKECVENALKKCKDKEALENVNKSLARTFQAIRIDVNKEFEVLYAFLEKLPEVLNPGGRVAILTFHSGEDRLVKQAFKEGKKTGIYSEIAEDVIRPGKEECIRNPRAKSTKLRYAIKRFDFC